MGQTTIAIVGAGPAGCMAAYQLHKLGCKVVVFEQASVPGGRTRSCRKDGHILDTGAAFVTNFYPRVHGLAKELGIADQLLELHRLTGLHSGSQIAHLNISSSLSFLGFPLVGWLDKLRMAKWTAGLTMKRSQFDLADPSTLCHYDARSIAEYAQQCLTPEIYDYLIRPGIEPFWYFSCDEVSEGLMLALTAWAAGAKFYAFTQGIDVLCQKLLQSCEVHYSCKVEKIFPADSGVRIHVLHPQPKEQHFDGVVLATPANIANNISSELPATWISQSQRSFLQSQAYVPNIHAAFKIPQLAEPPKVSSILPCGPGKHDFAALSFHHKKAMDKPSMLVSLYLSGHESQRLLQSKEEHIYDHCWQLMKRIYPALPEMAEPYSLSCRRHAIPIHAVGRYAAAHAFQETQTQLQSPVWFCGDYLATATIEGAVATGERAAKGIYSAVHG